VDVKVKALEVVKKHGKAMALEMVEEIVMAAIEEVVKDSANPFDDAMFAVLKEPLKAVLVKMIENI
jgi:hypothetical protein